MKQHVPEEFSTRLIHWSPFVIMGNAVPPRDPDEDEEDEEDNADEPPVVREPDEGLACRWQSAYSISHGLGCERRSAAQKALGRRSERLADRAPSRL